MVEQARALNPKLTIIARAHSEAEVLHLKKHGASVVILGEHEIARAMVELVVARRDLNRRYSMCLMSAENDG